MDHDHNHNIQATEEDEKDEYWKDEEIKNKEQPYSNVCHGGKKRTFSDAFHDSYDTQIEDGNDDYENYEIQDECQNDDDRNEENSINALQAAEMAAPIPMEAVTPIEAIPISYCMKPEEGLMVAKQLPFSFPCYTHDGTGYFTDINKVTYRTLNLFAEQRVVAHRFFDVFSSTTKKHNTFAMCTSETGAGKTYVAAQLLSWFNTIGRGGYKAFVICPKIVFQKTYIPLIVHYGLPFCYHMNYESFGRIQKNRKTLKETTAGGLLERKTIVTNDGLDYEFSPASDAVAFAQTHPYMLILDECHLNKNEGTARSFALRAFLKLFFRNHVDTRCLFLSATPFDKIEQITTFLRTTGIVTKPLMTICPRTTPGYDQAIAFFEALDYGATREYLRKAMFDRSNKGNKFKTIIFDLFDMVFKPRLTFGMARPRNPDLEIKQNRIRYHLDAQDLLKARQGMSLMREAIKGMKRRVFADGSEQMKLMCQFTKGAMLVETAKLASVVQHARYLLEQFPTHKIAIGLNYISKNVDYVLEQLREFHPLAVTGRRSNQRISQYEVERQRSIDIARFNAHDTNHRLLIIGIRACGVGIDLHDTHGDFMRHILFMPSHFFIQTEQFLGRFDRIGLRSPVEYICACAKQADSELSFLESMARKNAIQKKIVDEHIQSAPHICRIPQWPVQDSQFSTGCS